MASSKARVQRKNQANASAHVKRKMLSAHLSAELRAKYGVRSARVCKGDTVVIVRGNEDIRNTEGKVLNVYTKTGRVAIDGVTINPGDYVFGDIDGTAVIPADLIDEVMDRAMEIESREDDVRDRLLKGASLTDTYMTIGAI